MRRIIFRGKSADGKWHYGSLVNVYNCETRQSELCIVAELELVGYGEANWNDVMEVDPSSVGQFTGLTDKNGKDIYEGDIVRYYDEIEDELVSNPIVYNEDYCSFCIDDKSKDPIGLCAHWQYEVIGNIHDKTEEK